MAYKIYYGSTFKKWYVEEVESDCVVFSCEHEMDARKWITEHCENIGEEADGFGLCELCGRFHHKKQ